MKKLIVALLMALGAPAFAAGGEVSDFTSDILAPVPGGGGGSFTPQDGNAASPYYTFSTQTNLGMYYAGTDAIGWSTNGAQALKLDASGNLILNAGGILKFNSRGQMQSPADGYLLLTNAAGTDFTGLRFGGSTSSFPMWKRSATSLVARLADDSANGPIAISNLTLDGNILWSSKGALTQTTDGRYNITNAGGTALVGLQIGTGTADGDDGMSGISLGTFGSVNAVNIYKNGAGSNVGFQAGNRTVFASLFGLKFNSAEGTHLGFTSTAAGGGASLSSTGQYTWTAGSTGSAAADTGLARSAAAVLKASNGTTGNASVLADKLVTAKSTSYTVTAGESGTHFTTTGAGAPVAFTIDPVANRTFTFTATAAQVMTVTVSSGSLFSPGLTGATRSTAVQYSSITVSCDGTNCYAVGLVGTFT